MSTSFRQIETARNRCEDFFDVLLNEIIDSSSDYEDSTLSMRVDVRN